MTQQAGTHVLSDQELAYIGFHAAGRLHDEADLAGRRTVRDDRRPAVDGLRDTKEIAVGGSYYGWGHDAKIAADVTLLKVDDGQVHRRGLVPARRQHRVLT
jgi:hypothetical protein